MDFSLQIGQESCRLFGSNCNSVCAHGIPFPNFSVEHDLTVLRKVTRHVIPAQAEIYNYLKIQDSRLRGNDINGPGQTFCETIFF